MGLYAKDTGGGDFKLVPEGTHVAICNMVVDLGHQKTTYMGTETVKHQVYIRWELPYERIEWTTREGEPKEGPMTIGKTYTLSLSEKANLRKDLEAWRSKAFTEEELQGFDLFKLLGVPCQLTIVHTDKNDRTYANVKGVTGLSKGMQKPEQAENELVRYSEDEQGQYGSLPEWLQNKINAAVDPAEPPPYENGDPGPMNDGLEDSIPF